ncbi:MAG: YebC/PmpR family DNA-binding transcriptional regulator [Candidatus Levybacteria bacterium]|nr:YebC/PmpR family DNA-binding transcriptional regulator [Candidatus Levybacteria bacterium]
MSGHSKWATIKRQKGVNDAKRGQLFTKLANAITIAVKQGGGNTDPEFNASLRLVIDKAKAANMPKDGIERAILKGAGGAGGVELDEVLYEGFANGGVGLLVEAVTDKKQRTVAEVKNTIEKNGGTMAGQGAVSYLFQKSGEIIVHKNGKTLDDILTVALDNNVSDYEDVDEVVILYTQPGDLQSAQKGMIQGGFAVEEASLVYRPLSRISVAPEIEEKVVQLVEKLEELDDVQKVYTNLEYSS